MGGEPDMILKRKKGNLICQSLTFELNRAYNHIRADQDNNYSVDDLF